MKKILVVLLFFISSLLTGCTLLPGEMPKREGKEFIYRDSKKGYTKELVLGDRVYIPVATPEMEWLGEVYGYFYDDEGDVQYVVRCKDQDPERWLISAYYFGKGYMDSSLCLLWKEINVSEHPDWIDPNSISINW